MAAHADSGLSAPAVICQTERMQGSEFLELGEREREKKTKKVKKGEWQRGKKKGGGGRERKTGSHTNA